MTVSELIDYLSQFNGNAHVVASEDDAPFDADYIILDMDALIALREDY